MAFTTTGSNSLEGLNETKYSYLELKNLSFPYCVSINSLFIDQQSTSTAYNTTDITVTLAHELGHYLGLHHVFSEDPESSCKDTDYCKDTPSYDKDAYDMTYQWAMAGNIPEKELLLILSNAKVVTVPSSSPITLWITPSVTPTNSHKTNATAFVMY